MSKTGRSLVAGVIAASLSQLSGLPSPAAAAVDDPVVVRILGGGHLQVTSPDDQSLLLVTDAQPGVLTVSDQHHAVVGVNPCVTRANGTATCPIGGLTSVTILTGLGDDQVGTRTTLPIFVLTGAGNDIVVDAYSADAQYLLGDGDDEARPSGGPNEVLGGPGTDDVWYREATAPLEISLDDLTNDGPVPRDDNIHSDVETIIGGSGNDVLIGSDADNVLDGRDGNDTLLGMGGADLFAARGNGRGSANGADTIFGGTGIDTVAYDDRTNGVAVRLDDQAFDGEPGESDNVGSDVENIIGSSAPDVLTGSAIANHVVGLAGNDLLDGGHGDDVIDGGPGTDTVSYADRTAALVVRLDDLPNDGQAGEADNVLQTENVTGGSGNDVLVGDKFRNTLSGGAGDDLIKGLGQDDVLAGGPGRDVLDAGSGSDTVSYADHVAPVQASLDGIANDGHTGEGDNLLNVENLIGGSGSDMLVGSPAPNVLRGLLGNDTLLGLDGNDTLIGSEGTDFADGGGGVDTCQVESSTSCP